MPRSTAVSLTLASLVVWPCFVVEAQPRQLVGRVYAASDSARSIGGVEVALLPGLRTVRTDSAGAFRFLDVSPGLYSVRARQVGFEVAFEKVAIERSGERIVHVEIPMRVGAHVLAEITIAGHRTLYPARLAEPYARVAAGKGVFFTRELIDSLQPWDVNSLMLLVPGVRVSGRALRLARCQNHGATFGSSGNVHVFIDGVRQTHYGNGLTRDAAEVLRDVMLMSVQLVEVHRSISTIPLEYTEDACGAILIWSR